MQTNPTQRLRSTLPGLALLICCMLAPAAWAQTPVSGTIDRDTTWNAAGSPYVLAGDVEVLGGATLSILAGVNVRFEPEARLLIGGEDPGEAGRLLVVGSGSDRVRLETATPGQPAGAVELRPGAAIQPDGGGSAFRYAQFVSLDRPLTMRGSVAVLQDVLVLRAADPQRPAVVVELDSDAGAALRATRLIVTESAGGGMSITGGGNHELVQCRFFDNAGRGLLMDLSVPLPPRMPPREVLLRGCAFVRNNAPEGHGGGALLGGNTTWTVEDAQFEFNTSERDGGGLSLWGSGDSVVRSSEFYLNRSGGRGGGLSMGAGQIEDTRFLENVALDSDGGGLAAGSDIRATRCDFELNSARRGGAIYGEVVAVECRFVDNTARFTGGAIQMTGRGMKGVIGSVFESNSASASGGAIDLFVAPEGQALRIEGATFVGNSADLGGAIGGISGRSVGSGPRFRFVGNHFEQNLARRGGAIHVCPDAVEGTGLDLSPEGDAVNRFSANLATTGSAIANDSAHGVEAQGVCWGVPMTSAAQTLIHDGLDDPALGIVAIDPIDTGCLDCPQDLDGDGALTIFDLLVFQGLFAIGDPAADFDGDGTLTIFDFLSFQSAFATGCP